MSYHCNLLLLATVCKVIFSTRSCHVKPLNSENMVSKHYNKMYPSMYKLFTQYVYQDYMQFSQYCIKAD